MRALAARGVSRCGCPALGLQGFERKRSRLGVGGSGGAHRRCGGQGGGVSWPKRRARFARLCADCGRIDSSTVSCSTWKKSRSRWKSVCGRCRSKDRGESSRTLMTRPDCGVLSASGVKRPRRPAGSSSEGGGRLLLLAFAQRDLVSLRLEGRHRLRDVDLEHAVLVVRRDLLGLHAFG